MLEKFSTLTEEICKELENNRSLHNDRFLNDDILDRLDLLFTEKIGVEYSKKEIEELIKIGEDRYENKIPPGFKDASKSDELKNGIRKYGDFIVWKQIMDYSKELDKGIIFITDDRKDDWWTKFNGKTLHPRPELIEEFKLETKKNFHMYQSDRFLEYATDFLKEEINQDAIKEIRELRKLDELNINKNFLELTDKNENLRKDRLLSDKFILSTELNQIMDKKYLIEKQINEEQIRIKIGDNNGWENNYIQLLLKELEMIKIKETELNYRLILLNEKERYERNNIDSNLSNGTFDEKLMLFNNSKRK